MRRFLPLSIPKRAHPLVRRLYVEMSRQMCGPSDLADRAGITRECINGWRTRRNPRIQDLEACFNALGKRLIVADLPDESGVTEREARRAA